MKKLDLSYKAKKTLIITGSTLICVGAIAAALTLTGGVSSTIEPQPAASSSPSTSVVISVPPIEGQTTFEGKSGTSSAFVPKSGASQAAELTKIEKPVSAPPAPSVASGTSLTDKNKKPSYSSSSTAAKSSNTKKASSSTTKKTSSAPKGKSYMPGFGYVDGTGGGEGTTVGNAGDELTGNKVGIMD